jgi:hypothetical protein
LSFGQVPIRVVYGGYLNCLLEAISSKTQLSGSRDDQRYLERMRKERRYTNCNHQPFWRFISALLATIAPFLSTADGIDSIQGSAKEPFSLKYSLDYSRELVAKGEASCEPGYGGVILGGHFNEQGDPSRNAIRWLAHVDAPGHIHWAVRLGNETASFPSDLTCRQNVIYSALTTGPNRGSIGKFDAESLMPIKAIRSNVSPQLNEAFFEFLREPSLPVAISIIQDSGDGAALTIISENLELALSKIYSIPAFATGSRDPFKRLTRCRVFRAQDGSGYYLVFTDVQRTSSGATSEVRWR